MLAVRVPPSASSTSQSSVIESLAERVEIDHARRLRPISRWISVVRPSTLPSRSRRFARAGAAGQHAVFGGEPAAALGRPSSRAPSVSMLAVQSTVVRPAWISTLPGAVRVKAA